MNTASPALALQDVPTMLTRLVPLEGKLALPVVDGTVVRMGKRAVLVGGMTKDFKATPAIQMREPDGSWRPVGNQLIEPRIDPSVLVLPDNRLFVFGGFGGSAAGQLEPRVDGELLDPRVAGSSRLIAPPAGTSWQAPSAPVLLEDGSIALVAANTLHRLNPNTASWAEPLALGRTLAGSSLCRIGGNRLLACGVDPETESTQVLEIEPVTGIITPWKQDLGERILGARLFPMEGGTVLLMGWPGKDGRPVRRTFVLDPASHSIEAGPTLPLVGTGPSWLAPCKVGRGIVVMMTVREKPNGRDRTIAYLLQLDHAGRFSTWRLSKLPKGRRQMLLAHGAGGIELIGGYDFLVGRATLMRTTALLTYGTGPSGD